MNKLYLNILIVILTNSALTALDLTQLKNQYGIGTIYSFNQLTTNINSLSASQSCCAGYNNGNGSGFQLYLSYMNPLKYDLFYSLKASVNQFSSTVQANEIKNINYNNSSITALVLHQADIKFLETSFIANFGINFIYDLNFSFGGCISYPFMYNYSQVEKLIQPENYGTFENGKRERAQSEGQISDINKLNLSFTASIFYDIIVSKYQKYMLSPEINFRYNLNSYLNSNKLNYNFISIGIVLKYNDLYTASTPLKSKS
ncbi:MAG: hypothetical protein NT007_10400 [Candidatus Kapabacteria bacterium]|nr:hypothetical protein [Candidatus Kapabacteria bacterium]